MPKTKKSQKTLHNIEQYKQKQTKLPRFKYPIIEVDGEKMFKYKGYYVPCDRFYFDDRGKLLTKPIEPKPIKSSIEGLEFEPRNEQEVVFLFGKYHEKLGFSKMEYLRQAFPDALGYYKGKKKYVEFEFKASRFNHMKAIKKLNIADRDMIIVCWENNRKDGVLSKTFKIIAMKDEL